MSGKIKLFLLSGKRTAGFRKNDLLGIAIMLIPFIISIRFNHVIPGWRFLFFSGSGKSVNIRPGLITAFVSVAFYAALIVRYDGLFRAGNLIEALISVARTFLNCWVIASLATLAVPTAEPPKNSSLIASLAFCFQNAEAILLLFALALSWLGMKTIAKFSWVLFILAALKRLLELNSVMGMSGAVFAFGFAISLLLQLHEYSVLKDIANEFTTRANRREHSEALDTAAAIPKGTASGIIGGTSVSDVRINLDALDVNKDGVVDDRDFALMQQKHK